MSEKKSNNSLFHDEREPVNIVFMGHVDAGKSTTCGQILLLTGQADDRVVEKYKEMAKEKNRESWWIAYIMDTNEEERNKGKTVEVGTASFSTETRRYTILDAPGHKNYVPAMISGASQADIGILVVSARKGEFEAGFQRGGQTREHALLAKTLGITKIIIAVNKMDDETVKWDKERFDLIIEKTTAYLKQCGYRAKDISSLAMSGLVGLGITQKVPHEMCHWTNDDYLMNVLDRQKVQRNKSSAIRVPVVDRYKDMGAVVVIGKIESGIIKDNTDIIIMPGNIKANIVEIGIKEDKVKAARCGEMVNIYLKGIEINQINSGDVLCNIENISPTASIIQCEVYITDLLPHKPIITSGYSCVLHAHSVNVECEFLKLGIPSEKKKGEVKKIKYIRAQSKAIAKLKLNKPISLERYEDFPQLGRFTLRDEGKTIAIGRILKLVS